jgi:hypothetical protein
MAADLPDVTGASNGRTSADSYGGVGRIVRDLVKFSDQDIDFR